MKTVIIAAALVWVWPAAAQAPRMAETTQRALDMVRPVFDLTGLPAIDPALREQGERLAAEHLERLRGLAERWLERERPQLPEGAPTAELDLRVRAWVFNEIAVWRADSLGPEDDAIWRQLRTRAGLCQHEGAMSPFAQTLVQLQALPPGQRAPALERERERLARWGTPRPRLPEWPEPLPERQLAAALDEARRAAGQVDPPMVPVLADAVLRLRDAYPLTQYPLRCEMVRWWLQRAGDRPGVVDVARLMLMNPLPPPDRPPLQANGYPTQAARFGVTGRTKVEILIGADGQAATARVVGRTIEVPGLQGQRPLAFETVFDAAALARVPEVRVSGNPGERKSVEFAWTLD